MYELNELGDGGLGRNILKKAMRFSLAPGSFLSRGGRRRWFRRSFTPWRGISGLGEESITSASSPSIWSTFLTTAAQTAAQVALMRESRKNVAAGLPAYPAPVPVAPAAPPSPSPGKKILPLALGGAALVLGWYLLKKKGRR